MSTVVTVTVNQIKARLAFSRVLTLGSEYTVAWDGEGTLSPSLILTNPLTDEVLAQTDEAGVLKLNTLALVNFFRDNNRRPKTAYGYAYADSVVLGYGNAIINYSPLSFEEGADPELATGLADAIQNHIADTNNPHNVTAAQIGAATSSHTHSLSDLPIYAPDGREWRMKFKYIGGYLTIYFEEET